MVNHCSLIIPWTYPTTDSGQSAMYFVGILARRSAQSIAFVYQLSGNYPGRAIILA
ncbi:Uncharacterized protein AC511_0192 [Pseudomonas coronafaciens pv. oryzae]|nr:Uncharacterized protein AC511_0192 [Pseudomonas coronafaciens pv. oryzae]